jgi:hypothetical protein
MVALSMPSVYGVNMNFILHPQESTEREQALRLAREAVCSYSGHAW